MLGTIKSIEEMHGFEVKPIAPLEGKGGRLGLGQMINSWAGCDYMDGYKVETDKHKFYVLIDNAQSCCESWGYAASNDDLGQFIGSTLLNVNLTDTELNKHNVETTNFYGDDGGGIQFVDFVTSTGTFQLSVYNAHNGYYGHSILVAKDQEIILNETL